MTRRVLALCLLPLAAAAYLVARPPGGVGGVSPPPDAGSQAPAPLGPDAPAPVPRKKVLRVSADPNNLPFTNDKLEGFENKIAALVAADLGAEVEYTWRAQRRGFFRQALKEGECDVVLGVPVGFDLATTTAPYYRSTYAFVTRTDRAPAVASFDDPALKALRVGVQLIGDDGYNTPPAHALAARGVVDNVVGFTVYGDYAEPNPTARIVEAVARGDVDVAVVWGPTAGYFAKKSAVRLALTPVAPAVDASGLPFTFGIALGVRRGNTEFRDRLDAILKARRADIDKILDEYGVPRVAKPAGGPKQGKEGPP
ncbi:substrate-binding domain-containing protein [Gemmata sp.]|uniref:substrate-binding domain-containing protein n=1 Tax=Gemmata sp. TaxID=1914242 RepID=UPI003F70BB8B